MRVAAFATQGTESRDAVRVRLLVSELPAEFWEFDHDRKLLSGVRVFRKAARSEHDLIVMEGTGFAGGLALILASLFRRARYVVSSGDAVAPFAGTLSPALRPIAALYERALYSMAVGAVGWSPYITGRALTLGARRAMTAPHKSALSPNGDGLSVRERLGISEDAIVVGVVGSLAWNRRRKFCYGLDLVQAVQRLTRQDVVALIVGEGSGVGRLTECAGDALNRRVFMPGAVASEDLHHYIAAMDLAVLSQSVDAVGSFRYTTKLSDYMRASTPVISTRIPAAYDLGTDWMWRLPGEAPWDAVYLDALSSFLETLERRTIEERRGRIPNGLGEDVEQRQAVTAFLSDLAAETGR